MPARKSTRQAKQAAPAPVEPVVQATEQTDADTATRRVRAKFTRGLRRDKATYDLVHGIVSHLAQATGQDFTSLWSNVTDRDDKHFLRHFRKQKREQDPFRDIKNAIPAYSFFTKEHNSKLKAAHPDKSFGEISKMVGELWNNLSAKERTKYTKLADTDKKRYQREIEERSRELSVQSSAGTTEATATTEATEAPAATPARSRARRGGRRQ